MDAFATKQDFAMRTSYPSHTHTPHNGIASIPLCNTTYLKQSGKAGARASNFEHHDK